MAKLKNPSSVSLTPTQPKLLFKSRNPKQKEYLLHLLNPEKSLIVAQGPAGCGKTYMAILHGIQALQSHQVEKLILCRPAVSADGDEKLGALPGTLEEKMDPFLRPMLDILYEYYTGKEIAKMIEDKVIEIIPLAYMRGRNLKNAWIILDEAQNCTVNLMFMILTRLCENSKIVITGDLAQRDRKFQKNNGLEYLTQKLQERPDSIHASIQFEEADSVRSKLVNFILEVFADRQQQ